MNQQKTIIQVFIIVLHLLTYLMVCKKVVDDEKHSWSQSVSEHIEYLMSKNDDICVITPAMITGSRLQNIFKKYPERSFDVGIAEEHAMTLCKEVFLKEESFRS